MRLIKTLTLAALATLTSGGITAQEKATTDYRPNIHGTIRGKYEYQTEEGKGTLPGAQRAHKRGRKHNSDNILQG